MLLIKISGSRKHLPWGIICGILHVFSSPCRFISFGHIQRNTIMGWNWESFQWKWPTFILCVEWRQKPVQSTFKSALVNKAIKTVGEINEPLQENSVYRVNLKYAKDGQSSSQLSVRGALIQRTEDVSPGRMAQNRPYREAIICTNRLNDNTCFKQHGLDNCYFHTMPLKKQYIFY